MSLVGSVAFTDPALLDPFIAASRDEYVNRAPGAPPRCWALLLGVVEDGVAHIHRLRFANNVRETSAEVINEFTENIIPTFGPMYANAGRGYWCDSKDLLAADREAEEAGMELLGSIHLHPDWHRIAPPAERQYIDQNPTRMDAYLFRNTGWPVNIILHLSQLDDRLHHTMAAWSSPPYEQPDAMPEQLTIHTAVRV